MSFTMPSQDTPFFHTKLCLNYKIGCNFKGCTFAHSKEELRPRMCSYGEKCRNKLRCQFYHPNDTMPSQDELFEHANIGIKFNTERTFEEKISQLIDQEIFKRDERERKENGNENITIEDEDSLKKYLLSFIARNDFPNQDIIEMLEELEEWKEEDEYYENYEDYEHGEDEYEDYENDQRLNILNQQIMERDFYIWHLNGQLMNLSNQIVQMNNYINYLSNMHEESESNNSNKSEQLVQIKN